MKQTAVEWLLEQYENNFPLTFDAINKAKAMEKEQIIDAYHINPLESKWKNIGEQYYNETFNK